jgi:hypothetical protein
MRELPFLHSVFAAIMLLSLVISPLAEHRHALLMDGVATQAQNPVSEDVQEKEESEPPCHESVEQTIAVDEIEPVKSSLPTMPCCPDQDCSPDKCLMHHTATSTQIDIAIQVLPKSAQRFVSLRPINHYKYIEERLRPPIA